MYNEEQFIGKCLDSLGQTTLPADSFEVLVVDGSSSDHSRAIAEAKSTNFRAWRLLKNPKRLPGAALNLGIAEARGEFIVRMDAHTQYPPEYLSECIAELQRTGAAAVGGCCITL